MKKKKDKSTFKLISYPDGENVEDIITVDDGMWFPKEYLDTIKNLENELDKIFAEKLKKGEL
jgi:hypothetical protein